MEQLFLLFKEVAETKNITLSAEKLHMSQPNVSSQIKQLENQYGARFFDRSNKGVTLTKEGEIFYSHVRSVLDILASAKEEINDLEKGQRGINLGATLTIAEYILPDILSYLYKKHPDANFNVKIASTEAITKDVIEKKVHIGLIEGTVPQDKYLSVGNFLDDELVVLVSKLHPWASRKGITLAELLYERLVTREKGSETRKIMEMAFKERGVDPEDLNITMELGSTDAIKQVVSAGLGITIISALTVKREDDKESFNTLKILDAPFYRPLSILTNNRINQTREECLLIDLLNDHRLLFSILSKNHSELGEHASKVRFTQPAVMAGKGGDKESYRGVS
ncbi:LysR family transcriptional regulator [Desulfosporosinus hippei]|uniref:DNA-binding transcriptional regulator, LysR family n=1 Tax=Desulfosporosinus hippei DSM 8344 TaxID=1121419 RepID=A0A1G8BFS1_9FIRM|nr:LysR family transcriptional regulator [Desulfosporosinus hippei]SDH31971.1 DNA-binding transcriptional regulator, LysR family [Desulfosporosinus hippei DSM 8344]